VEEQHPKENGCCHEMAAWLFAFSVEYLLGSEYVHHTIEEGQFSISVTEYGCA